MLHRSKQIGNKYAPRPLCFESIKVQSPSSVFGRLTVFVRDLEIDVIRFWVKSESSILAILSPSKASAAQHGTQERIFNMNPAVVFDEAQFPEFVHEQIDPRSRCADDLRQRLLRDFGKDIVFTARRAIVR